MNYTNVFGSTKRQFDRTMNRECITVKDFFDNTITYDVFFRRSRGTDSRGKLRFFYAKDTPINIGTVFIIHGENYIVISKDGIESDIYFTSLAVKCDATFVVQSQRENKYDGTPLYVWKGNIIVDGHNRYYMCKKLGVEIGDDNIEEIDLGDDAEEIDAMDWMLTHQLSSKNLSVGEKLAMTDEFKKEVALENEKKKSEAGKNYGKGMTNSSTPIGVNLSGTKSESDRKDTWTDSQTAKKAGVGVGTVARYDAIMKTDR